MNSVIPGSPDKDECNLAMLAHLLGAFTGFVGVLILWLVKKDEPGFVAEEAREALNFQITVAIALAASVMLKLLLIGFLLFPIIIVVNFIFSILGAVSASRGRHYRYPLTLRLVS
ncbi:MAG TPA: DUF4870 domain-containing protein [Noviherbaspirillum sp.]|uniref:DUF4870 domain-containing protein n=1 Tax=Noviherbaspirillum sp. TaxID=1926288 RepID=UPI002B4A57D9|nr:DUF4870 domain-containing protein [Noviherbaspirillum sp.]HJV87345.1 DUF4870 domain-containing protein [Noviherbaspirillum sp.]